MLIGVGERIKAGAVAPSWNASGEGKDKLFGSIIKYLMGSHCETETRINVVAGFFLPPGALTGSEPRPVGESFVDRIV
jgi:hypothetical protein